jgi:hypothetical protein|tara:strand:- start:15 stop:302 length:288 start_codon:yes stop_codon:yes gene_type:complete
MKLNRIVLIIAVIVISIWMYNLYRNRCLTIEYYSTITEGLMEHINDESKDLNSLYVMNTFVQLTDDDQVVQDAMDFAEMGDRKTLLELLEKVEKK